MKSDYGSGVSPDRYVLLGQAMVAGRKVPHFFWVPDASRLQELAQKHRGWILTFGSTRDVLLGALENWRSSQTSPSAVRPASWLHHSEGLCLEVPLLQKKAGELLIVEGAERLLAYEAAGPELNTPIALLLERG